MGEYLEFPSMVSEKALSSTSKIFGKAQLFSPQSPMVNSFCLRMKSKNTKEFILGETLYTRSRVVWILETSRLSDFS
jgi:hypothetical protein